MKKLRFSVFIVMVLSFVSCVSLKPHEEIYINDPEMQMGISDAGKGFQNYVHSIREGAVPVASGKSSGGCGGN